MVWRWPFLCLNCASLWLRFCCQAKLLTTFFEWIIDWISYVSNRNQVRLFSKKKYTWKDGLCFPAWVYHLAHIAYLAHKCPIDRHEGQIDRDYREPRWTDAAVKRWAIWFVDDDRWGRSCISPHDGANLPRLPWKLEKMHQKYDLLSYGIHSKIQIYSNRTY